MVTSEPLKTRTPGWAKALLVVFVVLLVGGAAIGGVTAGRFIAADEGNDLVVRSITREEQVVLLTAGLSDDVPKEGEAFRVLGLFDLPGSERALTVRVDFDGKFGIDGRNVSIEPTGENAYRISIPSFKYLGYDNPEFSVISESNGVLSWTTEEIDKLEVAEYALSDETADAAIGRYRADLEDQARVFYTNIVTAIDPSVTLEFAFAQ